MRLYVGVNCDLKLLDTFAEINSNPKTEYKIGEVYFSLPSDVLGQVREPERLTPVSLLDAEKFVKGALELEIDASYAINSPVITPKEIFGKQQIIMSFLRQLKNIGITSLIISSPALAKFIRYSELGDDFKLIASTVMNIRTKKQVELMSEYFDRICIATDKNRDLDFIDFCSNYMSVEVLVNEMCLYNCPWRQYHYVQESMSKNFVCPPVDMLKDFPIDQCSRIFYSHPEELLKSSWYRPEDLLFLVKSRVNWIKLSGRTMSTEWIAKTAKAYSFGSYDGNFMDLFPFIRQSVDNEGSKSGLYINNKALDRFMKAFFYKKRDCDNCGDESCNFCDGFMQELKEDNSFKYLPIRS